MNRYFIIFFTLLVSLFQIKLESSLEREYDCDRSCKKYCPYHMKEYEEHFKCEFKLAFLKLLPEEKGECSYCKNKSIFPGYVDKQLNKYQKHLKKQIEYQQSNKPCFCLWPEKSEKAADINNAAFFLFLEAIDSEETKLSNFIDNIQEQIEFFELKLDFSAPIGYHYTPFTSYGVSVALVVKQFRFSDYYCVCKDVEAYLKPKCNWKEFESIKNKLDEILCDLYPRFFELYTSCYEKHPSADIKKEIRFMKLLVNDFSGIQATVDFSKTINQKKKLKNLCNHNDFSVNNPQTKNAYGEIDSEYFLENEASYAIPSFTENQKLLDDYLKIEATVPFSLEANIFLEQGTVLNNLLLHKDAIQALTQSIQLNPSNRDAYIERALAYFETNQIELAIKDYKKAKELTVTPPFRAVYIPENKTEFATGLISGTLDGAKVAIKEFLPSLLSSFRGISNGLWALVCSPKEVSQEMVLAAYSFGEFIYSNSINDCLQCAIPELKELALSWGTSNDYSRGKKIGYIIGKYGVDIFAPVGVLKGVNKVRALKRANTMFTLENCVVSQANKKKILEESMKRASLRETLLAESVKKGKILTKSANVQCHVMQKKHAWDKVIKLSGNIKEDFSKVIALLEEHTIFDKKFLTGKPELFPAAEPKIKKAIYEKVINNHTVRVEFETYLEDGTSFLKDAWVVTR